MAEGYTLDAESIKTLQDALEKLGQLNPAIFETQIRRWFNTPPPTWQIIKVTDGTPDSNGRYDAIPQYYIPRTDTWIDDKGTCKLLPCNGETLTEDVRYLARATEREEGATGKVVWVTMCCGGTSQYVSFAANFNASQNNYNFLSATYNWFKLNATANVSFTGFANGSSGRWFELTNTSTTGNTVTLANESGSSSAANRISTPDGTSLKINPLESVLLKYDAVTSRWLVGERPYNGFPVATGFGAPITTPATGSLYLDLTATVLYVFLGGLWFDLSSRDRVSQRAYVETTINGVSTVSGSGLWYNVIAGPYTITLGTLSHSLDGAFAGFRVSYDATGTITFTDSGGSFTTTRVAGEIIEFMYENDGAFIDRWYVVNR